MNIVGLCLYAISALSSLQCDVALEAFDGVRRPGVAVLWGTFGTSASCLHRFTAKTSKPKVLLLHFSNEVCRRNRRCGEGELSPTFSVSRYNELLEAKNARVLAKINRRATQIRKTLETLPGPLKVYVSLGLEDNYTDGAAEVVRRTLNKSLPSVTLVRNPVKPAPDSNLPLVLHSEANNREYPGCIWANDGYDLSFGPGWRVGYPITTLEKVSDSFRRKPRDCATTFIWWGQSQGFPTPRFVFPRNRRLLVSPKAIRQLNKFIKENEHV